MDPVVELLLKNGVFGIIAGIGFYLFFREQRKYQELVTEYIKEHLRIINGSTAQSQTMTKAMEDLAETVEGMTEKLLSDINGCKTHVTHAMTEINKRFEEEKVERAKKEGIEEGRREVTGRFKSPYGGKDEP